MSDFIKSLKNVFIPETSSTDDSPVEEVGAEEESAEEHGTRN